MNDDHNSVVLLDMFMNAFCIDKSVTDDLKFRCHECPFQMDDGVCKVKVFKNKFDPNYKDFGSMGDL